jgi:hypothetical protein
MCISSGTGTAYSFGVHEITSDFHGGSCFSTFSFLCSALEIVRFPFKIVKCKNSFLFQRSTLSFWPTILHYFQSKISYSNIQW